MIFAQRPGRFWQITGLTLIVVLLAVACGQKSSRSLDPASVVDIVGNAHNALLVTDSGDLWATGLNEYGELAIGQDDKRLVKATPVPPIGSGTPVYPSYRVDPGYLPAPVQVASNVKQAALTLSAGAYVTDNGELWVMGYENSLKYFPEVRQALANQSHNLTGAKVTRPVKVMDGVQKIVARQHLLVLHENGDLFGTGDNYWGELGHAQMISEPLLIDKEVTDVFAGIGMTFYLKSDGQLYSCGRNVWGELGFGEPLYDESQPTEISHQKRMNIPAQQVATDVKSVYSDDYITLLSKTDGELYMLGKNFESVYGDDSEYHTKPQLIASDVRKMGMATLDNGEQVLLILNNDDQLLGWGSGLSSLGVESSLERWTEVVADVKDFWTTPNLFVLTNTGQMRAAGSHANRYQEESIGQLGGWSWD